MLFRRNQAIRLNLALQGGGAHGAFTWGVLDRLIEDERVTFDTISATSAGAVNAVALLSGLIEAGRDGARAKLAQLWEAINRAGVPEFLRFHPLLTGLSRSNGLSGQGLGLFSGFVSPYDLNPFDINPLRGLITELIDFEALRQRTPVRLRIAATVVATGRARIFTEAEASADVVLASACLPTVHRAVEIGGAAYWDGGFSANPELTGLIRHSRTEDTLVVLVNPAHSPTVPRSARDISGQINRITFNQPFLREVAEIELVRRLAAGGLFAPEEARRFRRHRFHLIEAERYTAELTPESKLRPDWELLIHLHDAGRKEADAWLARDARHVGRRATADLWDRFLAERPGAPAFEPPSVAAAAE